ncbi:MurR/RpiR family transcriptional regulator [Leucobacter sp. L43]|uniref:MurR/RpiR family transcriptional regulator n=1 Tax=Leucobacter sp. L43 TaxID=2798040 RepID=UPI001F3964B2|nr:MurR/RpiR family transcriptional regulator [Leucobacter sp. L43]
MEPFVTSDTENRALTRLRERIAERWDGLAKSERAVSRVLTAMSAERLLYASAAELGAQSKTSNASVVRTLQTLGYAGLSELKQEVAAPFSSSVAPEVRLRSRLEHLGQDLGQIQREIWSEAQDLVALASRANSDAQYSTAVNLIVHADTVFCYGLGASGVAADHLALRLRRIGVGTRRLATDGFRLADEVMSLGARDLLVIFAPGRVTRDIEALLDQAQLVGASALLITDELHEQLGARVTASLTAPHTPTGLTAEGIAGILTGDVLVQGVSAVGPDTALRSSQALNDLRGRLGY